MTALYLGGSIAGPGDEGPVVGGEGERHHVPGVSSVHGHLLSGLNLPTYTDTDAEGKSQREMAMFLKT